MNVNLDWYKNKHDKALSKPVGTGTLKAKTRLTLAVNVESLDAITRELLRNNRVECDVVYHSPVQLRYRAVGDPSRSWTCITRRATKKVKDGKLFVTGPDASMVSRYQIP